MTVPGRNASGSVVVSKRSMEEFLLALYGPVVVVEGEEFVVRYAALRDVFESDEFLTKEAPGCGRGGSVEGFLEVIDGASTSYGRSPVTSPVTETEAASTDTSKSFRRLEGILNCTVLLRETNNSCVQQVGNS